jgi:hypothetical protein
VASGQRAHELTRPERVLARGVFATPWLGPNDEFVIVAITRRGRIVGEPILVPPGCDRRAAFMALWARLDLEDPEVPLVLVRGGAG